MSLNDQLRFLVKTLDKAVARGEMDYMQTESEYKKQSDELRKEWRKELSERRMERQLEMRNES